MKRICSLLLIAVLLFGLLPTPFSSAAEDTRYGSILVNFAGAVQKRQVLIRNTGDYLVPLSWLNYYGANITRKVADDYWEFYSTEQKQTGNFAKRVFIRKDTGEFEVGLYVSDKVWKKMKDGASGTPKRVHDKYYLLYSGTFSDTYHTEGEIWVPLAEILPLINVEVSVSQSGQLCLLPVLMTTFEALHLHNSSMGSLMFDADEVYGHDVMTVGGWVVSTTMDLRVDRLDVIWNTGKQNDYEELFKDYLTDNETYLRTMNAESVSLLEHIAEVAGCSDKIESVYDAWEQTFDALELFENIESKPTGIELFEGIFETAIDGVETIVSLYEYANTYCNQVDDHRLMLGAVYKYQKKPKEDKWPSYKAAMNVQKLYDTESVDLKAVFWETARDTVNDWITGAITKYAGEALKPWFIAFELTKIFAADEYEYVANSALMGLMDNIVEYSRDIYTKRLYDCKFGTDKLNDMRLCVMMSLIASRHAFHTYWEGKLVEVEADIDEILSALYTAGIYKDYDCADTHKNLKKKYEKLVPKLLCYEAPEAELVQIEYGIVMSVFGELVPDNIHWTLNDADGDGKPELLVHAAPDDYPRPSQIVIDADSFVMDCHTAMGSYQISEFVLLEGRDGWVLNHGGASAMNGGDFYYRWTGDTWLLHTGIETTVKETADQSFIRTEKIYQEGAVISEDSFPVDSSESLGYVYPYWEFPAWDDPLLTDFVIPGDPVSLMSKLDTYMAQRYGTVEDVTTDLNGDGTKDAVYAVINAATLWFSNISGLTTDYEPWAVFKDRDLTLVVAEPTPEGVRIRIQRLGLDITNPATIANWTLTDGTLTLGSDEFIYSPDGNAFVSLNGLRNMTEEELAQFQTMFAQDHWYCQATTSSYPDASMINVSQFFYNGYHGASATEEDRQHLEKMWGSDSDLFTMELTKITGTQMDEILIQYFGIDRSGIDGTGITQFTYIGATDSYILAHNDTNYELPIFSKGNWYGRDRAILEYVSYRGTYEIILSAESGRWVVISHMPILGYTE